MLARATLHAISRKQNRRSLGMRFSRQLDDPNPIPRSCWINIYLFSALDSLNNVLIIPSIPAWQTRIFSDVQLRTTVEFLVRGIELRRGGQRAPYYFIFTAIIFSGRRLSWRRNGLCFLRVGAELECCRNYQSSYSQYYINVHASYLDIGARCSTNKIF